MNLDANSIILAISAALLSGMGTAIISSIKEEKREKTRQQDRKSTRLNSSH